MATIKVGRYVTLVDDDYLPAVSAFHLRVLRLGKRKDYLYVALFKDGKYFGLLHRFVMGLVGLKKGFFVDHANHDGLDNRKANLRVCSHAENMRNRRRNKGKELPKGVSFSVSKGSFSVCVVREGKKHRKGGFKTLEEASDFCRVLCVSLHGEFANP